MQKAKNLVMYIAISQLDSYLWAKHKNYHNTNYFSNDFRDGRLQLWCIFKQTSTFRHVSVAVLNGCRRAEWGPASTFSFWDLFAARLRADAQIRTYCVHIVLGMHLIIDNRH